MNRLDPSDRRLMRQVHSSWRDSNGPILTELPEIYKREIEKDLIKRNETIRDLRSRMKLPEEQRDSLARFVGESLEDSQL